MRTRTLLMCLVLTAMYCSIGCAEPKTEKYVPRSVLSKDVIVTNAAQISRFDSEIVLPEDDEFQNHLSDALLEAQKEIARVRKMFEEGMVRKHYWKGVYTGVVIVSDEKAVYNFSLGAAGKKVGQVNKNVYEDKPYGKELKSRSCTLVFHDDFDSISSFDYGRDNNRILFDFYPDGKLSSFGMAVGGEYYRARWAEDGKLISHSKKALE